MNLAFIGMTHLGIVSAICSAEKGMSLICYDPDSKRVEELQKGLLPIVEPQLNELLEKNKNRLIFTHNLEDLKRANLVYMAPDIATDAFGNSDLQGIHLLMDSFIAVANCDAILVILSQVPPKFTRAINWPKAQLFYQVETLIFGLAVERALYPERFIIGANDPQAELPIPLLAYLKRYNCPILPMLYESAELSKIAINMFLVSSVTTANTIADLCEKIGADWSEMIPSLRLDKRIGQHAYITPGLGLSGGNLERDLATFCALSDQYHADCSVVRSWQHHSKYRNNWVLKIISQKILPKNVNPKFALWGLSYKKNTASIKNSPSIKLLDFLQRFRVKAYDPVVKELPLQSQSLELANSALEAASDSDVLIVMTPWDEFEKISFERIAQEFKGKTVIDPFGVFAKEASDSKELSYFRLGV